MHRIIVTAAVALGMTLHSDAAEDPALGFVSETAAEFSTTGDWDGNGVADVMILDKATGFVRLGYQSSPLQVEWSEPEASGMENVTGCSAGTFLDSGRRSLVFAAPEANRVQFVRAAGMGLPSTLTSLSGTGIGPVAVLGLPAPNAVGARQDLLIGSIWNGDPANRLEVVTNRTNRFEPKFSFGSSRAFQQANTVRLEMAGPDYAAFLSTPPGLLTFRLCAADGFLSEVALVTNLPATTRYVYGHFDKSGFAHLLLYQPGEASFSTRQTTRSGAKVGFGEPAVFIMPRPLAQLHSIAAAGETRLLAIFADQGGRDAGVYSFDGRNAPQLVQMLQSEDGNPLTGALILPGGHVLLRSGTVEGSSTSFQLHQRSGNGYALVDAGVLPQLKNRAPGANLLFFASNPFVKRGASLVSAQRRGDWTSQLHFTNTPVSAGFKTEMRGDETQGLYGASGAFIAPAPGGSQAALPNQLAPSMSVFSFLPASGDTVDDIKISPGSGTYPNSIALTLATQSSGTSVKYRFDSDAGWKVYTNALIIGKAATLQCFAETLDGRRSPVLTARYEFTDAPQDLDSDADGVPDFVEITQGLDPVESGWDADGDGASDMSELQYGSSITNALSKPIAATDLHATYNLVVTPRPWDPFNRSNSFALPPSAVCAFGLDGSLLGKGELSVTSAMPIRAQALIPNLPIAFDHRLISVVTEAHLDVQISATNSRIGRELVTLFATPEVTKPVVPYTYLGRDMKTEAAAWIAMLRNSAQLKTRHVASATLDIESTLAALLFQTKVGQILHSRGLAPAAHVSLFQSRPQDKGRFAVPPETLALIEAQPTPRPDQVHPAFRLVPMLHSLDERVRSTNAAALRTTAQIIYSLSATKQNPSAEAMPSPVDALREFIETESLPEPYASDSALPAGLLTWATLEVQAALNSIVSRPVEQMVLRVGVSNNSCTTLWNSQNAPVNLVDASGAAFRLGELFHMLPGSLVFIKGFRDSTAPCPGTTIEVIEATIQGLPGISDADADGNQMADSWEMFFLAAEGQDPKADPDGDLYTNLQEYLDGTSPIDPLSKPSGPPANLDRPDIKVAKLADGRLHLSWTWPEEYAQRVQFRIRTSDQPQAGFTDHTVVPTHSAPGLYEAWITPTNPRQAFFQVYYTTN